MNISYIETKLLEYIRKPGVIILLLSLLGYFYIGESVLFWATVLYSLVIINRRTNIKEAKAEIDLFDPTTPDVIDKIIKECFEYYVITSIGFEDKVYINAEQEKKMVYEMLDMVLPRLSEAVMIKARTYYQKELAEDEISKKVYLLVTNYVIQNNIEEKTKTLELQSKNKRKELTSIL